MAELLMRFEWNVKTAFFSSNRYHAVLTRQGVYLDAVKCSTVTKGHFIRLEDIKQVTLYGHRLPELEIQTTEGIMYGILKNVPEYGELSRMFRQVLGDRFAEG